MTACSVRSEFHFCQGVPRRKDGSIELRKSSRDYLLKARAERLISVKSGFCCLERRQGSEVSVLVIQGVGLSAVMESLMKLRSGVSVGVERVMQKEIPMQSRPRMGMMPIRGLGVLEEEH
jgi:hypothetical protein